MVSISRVPSGPPSKARWSSYLRAQNLNFYLMCEPVLRKAYVSTEKFQVPDRRFRPWGCKVDLKQEYHILWNREC